ncbi:MAG: hypothetical protein JSS98_04315 [Bacteroidetes bacterium]|nr:hypothetical protein [Bacteroidota bacterium]
MPTTVEELFKSSKLTLFAQIKWGQKIPLRKCGFYVVAISDKADELICHAKPQIDNNEIGKWIDVVKQGGKTILIDKKPGDVVSIKNRLEKLWLPDETILYIGKAGPTKKRTVEKRLQEYYETKLGSKRKHAGGHWLNVLSNLSSLNVFLAEYPEKDINEKEEQLISYFMEKVSNETKANLHDGNNCYPFANKEIYRLILKTKVKKRHGLNNQVVDCGKNWRKDF